MFVVTIIHDCIWLPTSCDLMKISVVRAGLTFQSFVFMITLVSNDQLRGKAPLEMAQIQQYVNFADQELLPAVATWVFPTLGLMQYNKQVCR